MKRNLVKILEEEVDVSHLSEENITEYLQAQGTVDRLGKLIVDPFVADAKDNATGEFYSSEGVTLSVTDAKTTERLNDKEIVNMLESTLATFEQSNQDGKRMYGVRRFEGTPTVDAAYVCDLLDQWQEMTLGERTTKRLVCKGEGIEKLAEEHKGRLVFSSYDAEAGITDSAVALYVAATTQVRALESQVIKPFERAFKGTAQTDPNKSTFDNKEYGGLMVQVKTVPRQDVDYTLVKEVVQEQLGIWADLQEDTVDEATTFFNHDLNAPRPYVAINTVLNYVRSVQIGEPRQRQEVSVLYLPEEATVLT